MIAPTVYQLSAWQPVWISAIITTILDPDGRKQGVRARRCEDVDGALC